MSSFVPTPLNIIAKIISGVVHPMLMPLLGTFILIYLPSPFPFEYVDQLRQNLLVIVAVCTMVLPSLTIGVLKATGAIQSVSLNEQKDRRIPFIFTGISYTICYILILRMRIPSAFFPFSMVYPLMLGGTISVVLALLVNNWFKISIHMMGIGGLAGAILAITYQTGLPLTWLFISLLALSGLTGFARLQLNAHTPAQVYTGFLAGAFCNSALIFIM